jgi:hypothetical protein
MPTAKPAASGICDWCRELADKLNFCSRCRIARYCGVQCQKSHWPKHAGICQPYKAVKTGQQLDLLVLIKDIAAALAMQLPEDHVPYYLKCPIRKKEKKSETEVLIHLSPSMGDEAIKPQHYDLTASSLEASTRSYQRMFGIGLGSIVSRAAALAINTALLLDDIQLSIEGRRVSSVALYRSEPGVPLWTVLPNPYDVQSEANAEEEEPKPEPQDRQHVWLGFKVQPADAASVTEDVYFVDFNAIALGIFESQPYEDGELYLVSGWSAVLRRDFPLVYRGGSIYRTQEYLDRWAQLWPELKRVHEISRNGGNLDFHHHLLASKVARVEQAIKHTQLYTE